METEIKLYTPDLRPVVAGLERVGAIEIHPRTYERNVRYENVDQTLSGQGIVVRLRQDSRVRLTYKGKGFADGDVITREELEVEVSDFATTELILARLGYTPYMTYEKYRTTYTIQGLEIVVDELPYGNFTEIEGEKAAILALVDALGLQSARRYAASYSGLFDRVRHHLNLTVHDLTFDNFDGVIVPASAFEPIS